MESKLDELAEREWPGRPIDATLEMRDGETGELLATASASNFRADNADDANVLSAIERLERGETTEERVGFYRLRVVYPATTSSAPF